MSTLTTIQSGDLITNSRADINNNFTALNNDKIETSVLDTDTTLAANSDAKIATQKAVKGYVDAVAGNTFNGCKLTHSTTQSVGDTSLTTLTWDTEAFDSSSYHSGGSPTRITIPETGYYLVNTYVRIEDTALTSVFAQLYVDGATVVCCNTSALTGTSSGDTLLGVNVTYLGYFTINQYIEVRACATSASKNAQTDSFFTIMRVGS